MDPGFIILIILFIVAPLLEKLIKAGKQPQRPPQQRPRPTARPSAQVPRQGAPRSDDDELAAGMLPDDLWEILTGEKRPPRQIEPAGAEAEWEIDPQDPSTWTPPARQEPAPPPARAEQPAPARRTETRAPDWTDPTWRPTQPQRRQAPEGATFEDELPDEAYVRPLPTHAPLEIVSLEQLTIDDEVRHDAFHQRLLRREAAEAAPPRAPRRPDLRLFTSGDDLRRAVIVAEVLGPPKALE